MFINIPNNYASMHGDLIYQHSTDTETDIIAKVGDVRTQKIFGVKKFYSADNFSINITPLLYEAFLPAPYVAETTQFEEITGPGFPKIAINVVAELSEARTFTYASQQLEPPMMMTTMPSERILFAHESDSLWSISSTGQVATYEIYGLQQGESEYEKIDEFENPEQSDCAIFHIAADDYRDSYSALKVNLLDDGEVISTLHYTLDERATNAYRLAWISSQGSIEHYTFPIVLHESLNGEGKQQKTLRSAYGSRAEIEALSEIICAKGVWRVDDDKYTLLKVLTTEQPITNKGELAIVTIKIEEDD